MGDVTTYEVNVWARCPIDDTDDYYRLTIEAEDGHMIQVESLRRSILGLTRNAIFQESFTQRLRRRIAGPNDPVRVTTVGEHSGVKTTCVSS